MKLNRVLSKICAASVLAIAASGAQAAPYLFTLTGDYTASWQLDSAPTSIFVEPGEYFAVYNVQGAFPGASQNLVDLYFYTSELSGGMGIQDFIGGPLDLLNSKGPQLFAGTLEEPMFRLGSFELTDYFDRGSFTLTISEASAVPEPATMALALAALGLAGATTARRRNAGV